MVSGSTGKLLALPVLLGCAAIAAGWPVPAARTGFVLQFGNAEDQVLHAMTYSESDHTIVGGGTSVGRPERRYPDHRDVSAGNIYSYFKVAADGTLPDWPNYCRDAYTFTTSDYRNSYPDPNMSCAPTNGLYFYKDHTNACDLAGIWKSLQYLCVYNSDYSQCNSPTASCYPESHDDSVNHGYNCPLEPLIKKYYDRAKIACPTERWDYYRQTMSNEFCGSAGNDDGVGSIHTRMGSCASADSRNELIAFGQHSPRVGIIHAIAHVGGYTFYSGEMDNCPTLSFSTGAEIGTLISEQPGSHDYRNLCSSGYKEDYQEVIRCISGVCPATYSDITTSHKRSLNYIAGQQAGFACSTAVVGNTVRLCQPYNTPRHANALCGRISSSGDTCYLNDAVQNVIDSDYRFIGGSYAGVTQGVAMTRYDRDTRADAWQAMYKDVADVYADSNTLDNKIYDMVVDPATYHSYHVGYFLHTRHQVNTASGLVEVTQNANNRLRTSDILVMKKSFGTNLWLKVTSTGSQLNDIPYSVVIGKTTNRLYTAGIMNAKPFVWALDKDLVQVSAPMRALSSSCTKCTDYIGSLALSVDEEVLYLYGQTDGDIDGFAGEQSHSGLKDLFFGAYNVTSESLLWVRQFGSAEDDILPDKGGKWMVLDSVSGTLWAIGKTMGFIPTEYGQYNNQDPFLARINTDGSDFQIGQWGVGSKSPEFQSITIDPGSTNIFIGGTVEESLLGNEHYGKKDIFIMKLAKCDPGEYPADFTTCTLCGIGFYQPTQNTSRAACVPCAPGSMSNTTGSMSCYLCEKGFAQSEYNATTCDQCPAGTSAPTLGSAVCSPCQAGTYEDTLGSDACKSCDKNYYQDETGQPSCKKCPDVTESAAKSESKYDCTCPVGTFFGNNGILGPCQACPSHTDCPSNSTWPVADKGYWVGKDTATSSTICYPFVSCEQGGTEACGEGYQGNACRECASGYYRDLGLCRQCQPFHHWYLLHLFAFALPVIALIPCWCVGTCYLARSTTMAEGPKKKTMQSSVYLAKDMTVTTLLTLQFVAVMGIMDGQGIPDAIGYLMVALSSVNLNMSFLVAPECTGMSTSYSLWWYLRVARGVGFVAAAGLLGAVLGCQRAFCCVRAGHGRNMAGRLRGVAIDAWSGVMIALNTLYFPFHLIATEPFRCILRNPGQGEWSLAAEASLKCFDAGETEWLAVMPAAVAGFLLVSMLMPLSWCVIICACFKRRQREKPLADALFSLSLWMKYESRLHWWEITVLLRRFLVGMVLLLHFANSVNEIFYLVIFASLYFVAQAYYGPFRYRVQDNLETWMMVGSILCLCAMMTFLANRVSYAFMYTVQVSTFILIVLMVVIPWARLILVLIRGEDSDEEVAAKLSQKYDLLRERKIQVMKDSNPFAHDVYVADVGEAPQEPVISEDTTEATPLRGRAQGRLARPVRMEPQAPPVTLPGKVLHRTLDNAKKSSGGDGEATTGRPDV